MEENDEIGVRFVEFKATLMNYLSSTRQPVSAVKQDLYQIAVIAGKAYHRLAFSLISSEISSMVAITSSGKSGAAISFSWT